ncbi:hypothetical protein BHAP_1499 [Bifidobacterium hapali]|uniref:Uncharacterized protein n=2 Tax=Bifidobacterium hapali TaxID=1630172 RepID=A0A261FZ20_9BIFI|nr:hypothetical protein BHAP_1499 [Bifidobacterium hapali]
MLRNNAVKRTVIAVLVAISLLFAEMNITTTAASPASSYNPNAPAVEVGEGSKTKITLELYKDKDGTQPFNPDKDTLKVGESMFGDITWDWDDTEKPTLESPTRFYTIPSNVTVKDAEESTLYDPNGAEAGVWWIKDGKVYTRWNEDWLTRNPSDITSRIRFEFTLKHETSGNDDTTVVHFPGVTENIIIKTDKTEIDGKKTWALNDDGTITFTIALHNKFNADHVVLTDTMGTSFSFVPGSFQLDGQSIDASKVTIDGQTATVTLGKLPAAQDGGHVITYRAALTEAAQQALAKGTPLDQTQNKANWTWDGAAHPGHAENTPDLRNTLISKNVGGSTENLTWDVTINAGSYKFDMGGYQFRDQLHGAQHYTGTYEVIKRVDGKDTSVASGSFPTNGKEFTYTFGMDAGRNEYHIRYHTAYDDPKSMESISNTGTLTPHDTNTQPKGEDSTDFTPQDTTAYIHKRLDASASTNADGRATWTSTIYTSRMPATTDPTTLEFADVLQGKPKGASFKFEKKPVFKISDTTLIEGQDYDYTRAFNPDNDTSFNVKFKGDSVKAAFGKQDITVTYATICSSAPGDYINRSVVKFGTNPSQGYNAVDHIDKSNLVSKTGELQWNQDFDWSKIDSADRSKGAWVATWKVVVNEDDDPNNLHGQVNTEGKPIVVTEKLPEGMTYVPGGKYDIQAGNSPGAQIGLNLDATMTKNTDGTITFTLPTDYLEQNDHFYKAFAMLTYQTAAKPTGKPVTFTNTATATTGSTNLGSDSTTVNGTPEVIKKTSAQDKDKNRVTYSITVNPEGTDLVAKTDKLTLSDVMDTESTFVTDSLRVTNIATNNQLTVPTTVDNVKDQQGNPTTKLTLALPDATPMKVTYDVTPTGDPGDKVTLSNTAELQGIVAAASTNEKEWTVTKPQAESEGAAGTFTVTKVDKNKLDRYLEGAEFELWKVDVSRLPQQNPTEDQIKNVSTKVRTETTGTSGQLTFGSADHPLETNVLYYFMETNPPTYTDTNGNKVYYTLDHTLYYVMLKGTVESEYQAALQTVTSRGIHPSSARKFNAYDEVYRMELLPMTGSSMTARHWMLVGGLLATMSAMMLAVIHDVRKRKGLGW